MGDDRRLLLKEFVSAGVVWVIVRVDDEAYRLVGNALQRCLNFVGERGVLIVDHDDAVAADRGTDVAARALQHIDGAGNFGDFDLHFGEIAVLGAAEGNAQKKKNC